MPDASTASLDELADVIEKLLEQRGQALGDHQQAVEECAILQQLLRGTLGEIRTEATRLADAATSAAVSVDPAEIASVELGSEPVAVLSELQAGVRNAGENVTEQKPKWMSGKEASRVSPKLKNPSPRHQPVWNGWNGSAASSALRDLSSCRPRTEFAAASRRS